MPLVPRRDCPAALTLLLLPCRSRAVAVASPPRSSRRNCSSRDSKGVQANSLSLAPLRQSFGWWVFIQRERPSWPRPPARPQWASSGTHRIYVGYRAKNAIARWHARSGSMASRSRPTCACTGCGAWCWSYAGWQTWGSDADSAGTWRSGPAPTQDGRRASRWRQLGTSSRTGRI